MGYLMPTLSGITYEELPGSGKFTYNPDGGHQGERLFLVDWDDRKAFHEALLGWTEPVGDLSVRYRGQRFPGYDYLYCRNVTVEGLGELSQGADMASYPKAKVTATYTSGNLGTSTADTDEDYDEDEEAGLAHLTEEWDFSGEFLMLPDGSYCWSLDLELVEGSVGLSIGTADIALTSDAEPLLRRDLIAAALNTVNSRVWYGFGIGHVLFLGAAARRTTTSDGVSAWEITYRFRARTQSYNEMYRPGVGWSAIEGTTTGDPLYAPFDFYNLFA